MNRNPNEHDRLCDECHIPMVGLRKLPVIKLREKFARNVVVILYLLKKKITKNDF